MSSPAPGASVAGPVRDSVACAGQRISYLRWPAHGEGTAIACAHPLNTGAAVWTEVAEALKDENREIIAVDYRGHGESETGGPFRAADYARDLAAVIDRHGYSRVHLVGGSIGGAVAVELHALRPELLASITLMGAAVEARMAPDAIEAVCQVLSQDGVAAWMASLTPEIIGSRSAPGAADRVVELAGGRDPEVVSRMVRATFGTDSALELARRLAGTYPPTLVITGEEDPTCPPAMADDLGVIFDARVVLLPGIGHLPMVEDPHHIARLISRNIAGAEGFAGERQR
ncbi:3-oxoadipate enol-lactonase/3-oxoadipate enol-lactonase/4-carboxymuconolactone decarboxylase [Amycolatopsis sulphurea]|uniref:3-oxoadipate enol-lactonase/3-oxoadipate enol-lactonase/4-carboxymuconolactone decarboxylase n=1 Tax=Amycolatopsis sulphurea TaxID=76022 RepID=A0A2A9FA34_9PSEU|nr:alpha/beta hydrolase [Amycolatopsis sulphurea]PFG47656.1 3-oxoadipate enol-lactonase/3-oxoadipate enol-lactonase/4-carboxymuconolactone decarboxylase [Amycolatopsis sulphurea]